MKHVLILSLLTALFSCNDSPTSQGLSFADDISIDTLFFPESKLKFRLAGWVYDAQGETGKVFSLNERFDTLILFDSWSDVILDTITGLPPLHGERRRLYFDGKNGVGLIVDAIDSRVTEVHRYDSEEGSITDVYFPQSFDNGVQCLGLTSGDHFFFDNAFISSLGYPKLSDPREDMDSLSVWNINHKAALVLRNDSLILQRTFGRIEYFHPNIVWTHFHFTFDYRKNEILMTAPFDQTLQVFDFSGELQRTMKLESPSYNVQHWAVGSQNICTPQMQDYMLMRPTHKGHVRYSDSLGLFIQAVNVGDPVGTSNHTALCFYDDAGKLVYSKEIANGFSAGNCVSRGFTFIQPNVDASVKSRQGGLYYYRVKY